MALSTELRTKILQQAKDIDKVSDVTARVATTAKNQQSAQIASRLDNPINSPSVQAKRSAQIARNLDNSLINKATTGTTNPAEMYRPGNVTESLFKTPNYISNNAMTEMVDRANARLALQQDNTATEKAREAAKKSAEQQKAAMERMVSDLYQKMEGYKNNGQTDELFKAEQEYAKLNDSIAQMNSKIHGSAMEEAKDWETRRYNEIMATGGRVLMANLEQLVELSDRRISEADDERKNGLTETQKQYNDLYKSLTDKYGSKVDGWLEYAKRAENKSQMAMSIAKARQAAEDKPFWASVGSVPLNMASGAGYLDVTGQNLQRSITGSDAPIDYNSPAQKASKMTNTIRGTVSEDMGKFGSFLYNTGMSMADSLVAMPMGNFGMALLGGSAATNAMQAAIERGASDDQALKIGLVAGALEAALEKTSIHSLFNLTDSKTIADFFTNAFKQSGVELTEEGLTKLGNTFADAVIMGNKSELNAAKWDYIADGYSPEKAEGMALKDWGVDLLLDMAGGALSGFVFGSFKSGFDVVRNGGFQKPTVESVRPKPKQETQPQPPVADITPTPQATNPSPTTKVESDTANAGGSQMRTEAPKVTQDIRNDEPDAKPAMGAADAGFDPYSHASIEYGAIEPGENPARVVDVPKSMDGESNVMQTVRTIMEADATPDAAIPELEQAVVKGEFSKMPITDQAASERAEATIRRVGYQTALADWRAEVRNGKVSKDSVAVGEALYNAAVNAKDYKSAVKIAVELSTQVRSAAQALQAIRMLKKLSPSAQLYGVKQSVDNLQKTLTDKYGKLAPNLEINEELAAKFLEAETEADRKAAEEALYKDIAKQIPATFADKWNAWRYLSMLGNARTHVRNIAGNAMFAPVRFIKNKFGAAMEAGAQAAGLIDKSQRTKAFGAAGKDLMDVAKADYENVKQQVLSAGKYNSSSDIIEENRRIFNNVVLETLRQGNSKALEAEDSFFSKGAYASSLASYLKAQGFTAADFTGNGMTAQQKDAARAYAIKEAQKATYRDINGFSEAISSIGFKNPGDSKTKHVLNSAIEGVMPFKKTPANILVRSVEYSPAGLVKAITTDAYAVAKGKITAGEYMDRLASGLTGTGLFALGCFLSNAGLLVGGTPEDEDQAELEGRQPYALEIGGKSITLDWLAPEAMPVFMGVELMEAIREGGGDASLTDKVLSFVHGLSGPMLEMSMMSSLQEALEATEYAFMANGALGYLKQAQPTLFGQLERSLESSVRQTTFTQEGDKYLNKDAQYMVGAVANKIPFYDYSQVPYIDAWGRTEDLGGTGERLFNNMLNPAYVSDIQETPVDVEIKRLEDALGVNLTPSRADKVLTINTKKVILTADEYITYAQAKGQNDLTFRQNLIDSNLYAELDDETKAKAMEISKELANVLAIQEAGFKPNMTEWQKDLIDADATTVTRVLVAKALESQAGTIDRQEGKKDKTQQDYFTDMLNDLNATAAQKRQFWVDVGYAKSTCPY